MATQITPSKTLDEEINELKLSLPKEMWFGAYPMYQYQGFWCPVLEPTIAFQNHFQAQDTDIILASMPKSGTTWLKSLLYAIVNRKHESLLESSLLNHNSHELVPHFEFKIYDINNKPDLSNIPAPRLFGTHLPYDSLATSIKDSKARIIYICRNPVDTFISNWHFCLKLDKNESIKPDMIEEYLHTFCDGIFPFGPFPDHVLGYWNESRKRPDNVLFLRFEELKADTKLHLKRLAEFIGHPFSIEEEKEGLIDGIIRLCSLQTMKELEVNKNGKYYPFIDNKFFFRKGQVGDWVNHLSTDIVNNFTKEMELKLCCSGLSFEQV